MTASLFVLRGREQGQRFYLDMPLVCIGRHRKNDIQLQDTEISRRHAQIVVENEQFYLEDLGSVNGSKVNSEQVAKVPLNNGDRILLGKTLLLFNEMISQEEARRLPNVKITDWPKAATIPKLDRDEDPSSVPMAFAEEFGQKSQADAVQGSEKEKSESHPSISHRAKVNISQAHLEAMYQTSLAVSHTLDIDELLERIMRLILDRVSADRGCIFLLDQQTTKPVPQVAVYSPQHPNADQPIEISNTILEYVLRYQDGILTENAGADDRFSDPQSISDFGIREAICVPMTGRYGVVGAIYVDTSDQLQTIINDDDSKTKKPTRLRKEDLQLLLAIGNQAGIAVEDTGFYSGLVQSERLAAIGQTIAVMSHHIKNTLQGFQGGGYLIEQGIEKKDLQVVMHGWKILQRNQDRVYNLVMDMLSFSKERSPYRQLLKIDELVEEVIESLQPKSAQAGVKIHYTPTDGIPPAMMDQESIHRAIWNVISNAVDAISMVEDKKPIEVHVQHVANKKGTEEPGFLEVHVQDFGPGIEDDLIEKVFSLFESTKGGRGTGLGLPVSKKIMKEHRGDIEVYTRLGEGTKFVLWLPIINSERIGETIVGEENAG